MEQLAGFHSARELLRLVVPTALISDSCGALSRKITRFRLSLSLRGMSLRPCVIDYWIFALVASWREVLGSSPSVIDFRGCLSGISCTESILRVWAAGPSTFAVNSCQSAWDSCQSASSWASRCHHHRVCFPAQLERDTVNSQAALCRERVQPTSEETCPCEDPNLARAGAGEPPTRQSTFWKLFCFSCSFVTIEESAHLSTNDMEVVMNHMDTTFATRSSITLTLTVPTTQCNFIAFKLVSLSSSTSPYPSPSPVPTDIATPQVGARTRAWVFSRFLIRGAEPSFLLKPSCRSSFC